MLLTLEALPITARRVLRRGSLFRVRRGTGPYLQTTGEPAGVEPGEYRCLRLWRDSRRPSRVYCDAVGSVSGRVHTLYLQGPTYRAAALAGLIVRPYRITVVDERKAQPKKSAGRRRTSHHHSSLHHP